MHRSGLVVTFDWRLYLDVARLLLADSSEIAEVNLEARQRAAVSRAYYSVFGTYTGQYLAADMRGRGNPHRLLVNALAASGDPRLESAGRRLEWLRVLRNRCDYDDVVPGLDHHCTLALSEAADLLGQSTPLV